MQAVKTYKTPSQLKGERYLRSRNLLVPPSTQRNTERVKLKARALRLKEEYRFKYLTRRNSSVIHRGTSAGPTVPVVPEESIIVPESGLHFTVVCISDSHCYLHLSRIFCQVYSPEVP